MENQDPLILKSLSHHVSSQKVGTVEPRKKMRHWREHTSAELDARHRQSLKKLKNTFEKLFEKYDRPFYEFESDIIDLETLSIVKNKGFLASLPDRHFRQSTVPDYPRLRGSGDDQDSEDDIAEEEDEDTAVDDLGHDNDLKTSGESLIIQGANGQGEYYKELFKVNVEDCVMDVTLGHISGCEDEIDNMSGTPNQGTSGPKQPKRRKRRYRKRRVSSLSTFEHGYVDILGSIFQEKHSHLSCSTDEQYLLSNVQSTFNSIRHHLELLPDFMHVLHSASLVPQNVLNDQHHFVADDLHYGAADCDPPVAILEEAFPPENDVLIGPHLFNAFDSTALTKHQRCLLELFEKRIDFALSK